ncbi:hypothetical protein QBK99_20705 [Corticibacterium sp. UT-5YL-CI-8]|nr:hypothetical protein [Tianweitania sp. UT-5YL-CI-8]
MASPWKFLARLMSPRLQKKQDDRAIKDVTAGGLAIAAPTDAPAIESLHIADRPVPEQSQPVDRADAVSTKPEQPDESRSNIQDVVTSDSRKLALAPAPDPVSPDDDIAGAKVENAAEVASAKRKTRAEKDEAAVIVSQVSLAVPSVSDGMVNLDEEIAVLRTQLAGKLRLQNAQLKKMLARFER